MTKVVLPELGEGIEKATISYWYFKAGDQVKEKDDLVELATDKATFNLPSPCSGTLEEVLFKEGDTVNVGEVVAVIDEIK
jgi:pyruvate/2-oxoglutarate dehydrogenase complex dihydrolipoamide acyltransferase (E2) component